MKRILQLERVLRAALFVLLLSVVGMTKAQAQSFTVGVLNYTLNGIGATVTGHVDGMLANGVLVIPTTVTYEGTTYSVTSIGRRAFAHCSGLKGTLTIPNSVTTINEYAFAYCSGFRGNLIIPNSVISIGYHAFRNCSGLIGDLNIPNSVTSIGEGAFCYCTGLSSIEIPNSVTYLGAFPFSSCIGLEQIIVDSGNTVYDSRENCNAIIKTSTNELVVGNKNTIIPNSVTSIGNNAFLGCNGLISIGIPNSVTTINKGAFINCENLISVIALAETPPVLGANVFSNTLLSSIAVYVPCGSEETYQSVEGWNEFSNITGMCSPGTIIASANPVEGGSITGAGTYESGTSCTVTATSNEGYTFMYWTEDDEVVSYRAEYSFSFICAVYAVTHGGQRFGGAVVKTVVSRAGDKMAP